MTARRSPPGAGSTSPSPSPPRLAIRPAAGSRSPCSATLHGLGEAAVATPPDAIEDAVAAAIVPEPADALIAVPPAPVDLGGIGKGLALRWACERIAPLLPEGAGALVDAGGDLAAVGAPPVDGWRVGIEDPVAPGEHVAVAVVPAGAIATSSVRVRLWRDPEGRAQHHLVDPRTSQPARTELLSVTVAAGDPAWAEVWTKALFLAGRAGDRARGPRAGHRGLVGGRDRSVRPDARRTRDERVGGRRAHRLTTGRPLGRLRTPSRVRSARMAP